MSEFGYEYRSGKGWKGLEVVTMRPLSASTPAREIFQARTRRAIIQAARLGKGDREIWHQCCTNSIQ